MKPSFFKYALQLILIITGINACNPAWDEHYPGQEEVLNINVWDAIKEESRFSSFVKLMEDAKLDTIFQQELTYTIFAPTNEAFAKIDSKTLSSLLEEKNKKALANILTYHVISGKIAAADVVAALKKGEGKVELKALNGQVLTVMQKDGKIWLKDVNENYSEIIATDVMGSNGVIHVINTVVMPN